MTDRYATVHLNIERTEQMPRSDNMYQLLDRFGLTKRTQEAFWVIAYDAAMNIRTAVEIGKGSYAKVPIHMPSIYTAVLASGSDRFQIAHNHPTGDVTPTMNDIQTTQAVMTGANALGLYFEDHHIVGPLPGQHFSFSKHKMLLSAPYTGEMNA
jgi:DNA repair protein RadC